MENGRHEIMSPFSCYFLPKPFDTSLSKNGIQSNFVSIIISVRS